MNRSSRDRRSGADDQSTSIKSTTAILIFGIVTLLYLVAIDHEEWFHLRPMSAGAVAISHSADHQRTGAEGAQAGVAR